MIAFLLAAFMMTSTSEIPPEVWNCRNQVEVWCVVDGCAAKAEAETTPMDIWARRDDGRFSICAYTGCWEGVGEMAAARGRLLWAADDVEFSSSGSGFAADVSLLIVEEDGVGFVRVGGLATPLLCLRAEPGQGG
jgi:hypothetical protein